MEQRRTVTENPSLMAIFKNSLGAGKAVMVTFTAAEWVDGLLTLTPDKHGRSTEAFTYRLQMLRSNGEYSDTTWGVLESSVNYDAATGNITIHCPDGGYNGRICFTG